MNVSPVSDGYNGASLFKANRGNLGLIVERRGGEAQRSSSQEGVTEITLLPTEPITSKMDGS